MQPITKAQAKIISTWTYPTPYELYSFEDSLETIDELLTENYYVLEQEGEIIGYACFGQAARIPCQEEGVYSEASSTLDIGLGLAPQLCGQGQGATLSVAYFNQRAIARSKNWFWDYEEYDSQK